MSASGFDFHSILQPGDHVVVGQTCAEPRTLTRALVQQAPELGSLNIFLGALFSDTFAGALPPEMRFVSYGAMGQAADLARRGLLDVLPERISRLPALFEQGVLRADVVLVQLAPGVDGAPPSLSLANDHVLAAARRARVVVAELNPHAPWTHGAAWPADVPIHHWVDAELPPLELPAPPDSAVARAIAADVASVVGEGATLQAGIGALPDAALAGLHGHRALGFHSGILGDAAVALIERGAITNARKGVDAGLSVANTVCGTAPTYGFVHRNPAVRVLPPTHVHAAEVLARVGRLHAINGALQVDLSGQANCESVNGRAVGGIGGLLDFHRAARASEGGRGIVVLPATAAGGTQSRIVLDLGGNPATIGRADADCVITEHGVADLRNATLAERARRLIAIAAPEFRERLRHDARAVLGV